jgi:outer membrane lipoprotein-sorting protein
MRHRALHVAIALAVAAPAAAGEPDARDIVQAAIDAWRGTSSTSSMTMTIHRPSWERTMAMTAWTKGSKHSLVRVTEPRKDAGNGTLLIDGEMWTFTPKINRIIKVPSSMMSQNWMGSDFSNKDVARSDDIVDQYTHRLLDTEATDEGHTVWVIESIPHEDAAVVWGRQVLRIRDDHVTLGEAYYDQDGILVKQLETLDIEVMGGRPLATLQRMTKTDNDEWTEIRITEAAFDMELPDRLFTLANLRNPRE